MSRNDKMKFIRLIEGSELDISGALAKYDVPRSTYYRWNENFGPREAGNCTNGEAEGSSRCSGRLRMFEVSIASCGVDLKPAAASGR